MKVTAVSDLTTRKNDVLIDGILEEHLKHPEVLEAKVDPPVLKVLNKEQGIFQGKLGQTLVIRTDDKSIPEKKVVLVGLGKVNELDLNAIREASTSAIKTCEKEGAKNVGTLLHEIAYETPIPIQDIVQAMVEASNYELYKFDKYIRSESKSKIKNLMVLAPKLKAPGGIGEKIRSGISIGNLTSQAQTLARDLASEPSDSMTPDIFASVAKRVAKENDLEIEILGHKACKQLGMESFLAVSKGSNNSPRFVVIRYIPKGKPREKIVIIGKGVTFDSGGLSIKPAEGMETMKCDKSGAAAVLGVMSTMKELQPDVAVTMIAPLVENMTGGSAIKPGAIVKTMNGTSIVILNTDAEGRLILADAIAYAVMKEKPDKIIDIATLTGACVVALGDDIAGVMSNDNKLAKEIINAGNAVGEPMWRLPVSKEHRKSVESKVADVQNIGNRGQAGAQAGYALLEKVKNDAEWPNKPTIPLGHIDIAGPAWPKKDPWPTGFGTRTLIRLVNKH